ncbi:MAG: ABC transporter permease [Chloroflexi bacterium]|nr:ABC transporter permease [Chloroflexota bacterium]
MTSRERAVTPSAWVDHSGAKSGLSLIGDFVDKTVAVTVTELRKMRHDVAALFMRMLQPVLWLAIYGEVMSRTRAITTGDIPFIDFITPGIMAQSALFIAIFSGMSVIWERDLGIAHKFVASPAPRDALALGKALSGGVRALTGAAVVYVLGLALGVKINLSPLAVLGVLAMVVLAATTFSAFSLVIAFIVKTKERMMGIGQVLTMPFFFASNAIYPTSEMPGS